MIQYYFVSLTITAPKLNIEQLYIEFKQLDCSADIRDGDIVFQNQEDNVTADLFLTIEENNCKRNFTLNDDLRSVLLEFKCKVGEACSIYILYTFQHDGQANLFFEKEFISDLYLIANSVGITTYYGE